MHTFPGSTAQSRSPSKRDQAVSHAPDPPSMCDLDPYRIGVLYPHFFDISDHHIVLDDGETSGPLLHQFSIENQSHLGTGEHDHPSCFFIDKRLRDDGPDPAVSVATWGGRHR